METGVNICDGTKKSAEVNGIYIEQWCPIMCHAGFHSINKINQRRGNQLVKSAGVMIGWNENLHTLGPPWQRLDIPGLREAITGV